jgi:alkanesulfonate monooxygenase SsuD/methylene tetrahydromethanopterin reductase-like flavin-dependent oxidoreductase (luciferase family)
MPDPWTCLSALALVTEQVMLGSVVNCIYHRHPAHLARLASDLDQLSNGRLMLGLGIGWVEEEFRAFNIPFPPVSDRQRGMEEAVAIVKGVWGATPFTLEGTQFAVRAAHITPPKQSRVPVMIAGGGERITLRTVARHADACNFSTHEGIDVLRAKLAMLRHHCEAVGRPYDEILKTDFVGWPIVAATASAAREKLEQVLPGGVPPWAERLVLCGTPDSVTAHLHQRVEAGMQYFVVQILDGQDHETIRLFADVNDRLTAAIARADRRRTPVS